MSLGAYDILDRDDVDAILAISVDVVTIVIDRSALGIIVTNWP